MLEEIYEKIIAVLIIILLLISAVLIIIPTKEEIIIKQTPFKETIPLDHQYISDQLDEICNVVHEYPDDEIPKGRAWGTWGEHYTRTNILMPEMNTSCGLDDVHKILIEYLDRNDTTKKREYSSKIETINYSLSISNAEDDSPVPVPILKSGKWSPSLPYTVPISECFPSPTGVPHYELDELNCTYNFSNTKLKTLIDFFKDYLNYHINITIDFDEDERLIIGQPLFISSEKDIPKDQSGYLFIIEDKGGIDEILKSIGQESFESPGSNVLIIRDNHKLQYSNINQYDFTTLGALSNQDNLTQLINILKSNVTMFAGNIKDNKTLTFIYNFDDIGSDLEEFVFIFKNWKIYDKLGGAWTGWGLTKGIAKFYYNNFNNNPSTSNCVGIIFVDYNDDAHFMGFSSRNWEWYDEVWGPDPHLPFFSINQTLGNYIIYNRDKLLASGDLEQNFSKQTTSTPGIISYNIVGYHNISSNPNEETIVLSNRYDGWWGETPGDSGAGAAILLGICKYIKENEMPLKHNLLVLFTTGEEYGKRGAWHYVDSHKNISDKYNYLVWIGLDQLAFDHNDNGNIFLGPQFSNVSHRNFVWDYGNRTDYQGETGYEFRPDLINRNGDSGGEDDVWLRFSKEIDTICFVKHGIWTGYHRSGMDYEEGDSSSYINEIDLESTSLMALETVRHLIEGTTPTTKKENVVNVPIILFFVIISMALILLLIYLQRKK